MSNQPKWQSPPRIYSLYDTNIFRLLNHVDRSIIEKYIQGYSIKSIADESEYSKAFVSERIYVFLNELKKEISKKQSKVKN
ncbi:MAG: hypothetical protein BHV68_03855 [Bacteroidales bacterium 43_8]|nr:MAG: hypothetical protein BHV68_03855 [Bacteroidales bacterium 43_8]